LNGINEREPRSIQKKEWVHIMVEGELYQSWRFRENHAILGKFKKGAAKIVACSPPFKTMVLPLYHKGMDEILPEEKPDGWESSSHRLPANTKSYVPKRGKVVNVYVGEPIDFTDLLPSEGFPFESSVDKNLLDKINTRLFNEMLKLESVARSTETKK
jgi:1-acyl-sn-glycerol-3-phosphate acyltransferase